MVNLSGPDYLVLGLFFAGILVLGFSAKLRENTTLQLIAAGRSLTLAPFVATLVTTWYGGILGVGEMFDWVGVSTWLVIGAPYYAFGIAYAIFMARRIRTEDAISLPERMDRCFGRGAGIIAALLILFIGAPAAHIFMLGTLFEATLPIGFVPAVLIGAVVGTLFLYRGGLLADARSNLLAFVMMYASFIIMLAFAIPMLGAPTQVISQLPETHRAWDGGQGPLFVMGWLILGAWTFVDPGFHQRVASARDQYVSQKGVFVSVAFWVLFDLLSIGAALYAFAMLGGGHGAMLVPMMADQILPPGVKGLFFTGVFGVIVSAMVGYTLVTGGTIGRDLIARTAGLSEQTAVLVTRTCIAVATLVGIVLALRIRSVVYIWYDVGQMVIPGLLIPTVVAYGTRLRMPGTLAALTMLAGSGTALVWYLGVKGGWIAGNPDMPMHIYPGLVAAAATWGIGAIIHKGKQT